MTYDCKRKLILKQLFIFFIFLFLVTPLFSQETLLSCLGKEEKVHFKNRDTGILYKLNQSLVNEFTPASQIKLKEKYLKLICSNKKTSPSLKFLYYFLINGKNIFSNHEKQKFALTVIEQNIPNLFFNYLSLIQGSFPTPHCLQENIPEVTYFLNRYKYLEGEIPSVNLLEDKNKIESIFLKIRYLKKIKKKCQDSSKKRK